MLTTLTPSALVTEMEVRMTKQHEFALITWIDSQVASSGWKFTSDLDDVKCLNIKSSGFIVFETDEQITLAPHFGEEEDGDHQISGAMIIPKVAITKRKDFYFEEMLGTPVVCDLISGDA